MAASCELPHQLPDELIVEILSRLPVKSLLKFRCVSKTWLSLILSPQFIKTHYEVSSVNKEYTYHRLITFDASDIRCCSIQSLLLKPITITTHDFDDSLVKCYSRSASIVGSCNGLICFALDCKDVYLWNPSIRQSKKLPESGFVKQHSSYTLFGFGYNKWSDDYNVVAIFCVLRRLTTRVKVYSLKTDSWSSIDDIPGYFPFSNSGKFINGRLHWAGFRGRHDHAIISLDLSKFGYKKIEMPSCDEVGLYPRLGVLQDYLCVTFEKQKTGMELWVKKADGERDSWQKIIKIPSILKMPLCIWSGSSRSEIFLLFGDTFSLYNSQAALLLRHDKMFNINGCFDANIYVESLVSPNSFDEGQRQEEKQVV